MEDNKMYITDDNGNEFEADILFTFDSEEYGKKYVLYQDPRSDAEEVYVSSYDDEGNLFEVTDEKELEMINEVLGAFDSEEEEQ